MALESLLIHGPRFTHDRVGEARGIVSDIDLTLVTNQSFDMPSQRVTNAFREAATKIPAGVATARQPQKALAFIDHLRLTGKSILSNGAQIYNGETGVMVVERALSVETTINIARELQENGIEHWVQDEGVDHRWKPNDLRYQPSATRSSLGTYSRPENILDASKGEKAVQRYVPKKPFVIVAHKATTEAVSTINSLASSYSEQGVTSFIAHEHSEEGETTFDVFITHKNSNKKDGIKEVAEMYGIDTNDMLAMGDGPNDTVLIEEVGIGVAMGNAVQKTRDVAVYIAPRQDEDGTAVTIEELVLSK